MPPASPRRILFVEKGAAQQHMATEILAQLRDSGITEVTNKPVRSAEIMEAKVRTAESQQEALAGLQAVATHHGDLPAVTRPGATPDLHVVPVSYLDPDVIAELTAISRRPEFPVAACGHSITDIDRITLAPGSAVDGGRWGDVRKATHGLKCVA